MCGFQALLAAAGVPHVRQHADYLSSKGTCALVELEENWCGLFQEGRSLDSVLARLESPFLTHGGTAFGEQRRAPEQFLYRKKAVAI